MHYLLIPDRPEDLKKYTEEVVIRLGEVERRIYQAIKGSPSLEFLYKMRVLTLALINPNYFYLHGQEAIKGNLLTQVKGKVEEYLEDEDTVVVCSNYFKGGVTRRMKDFGTDIPSFTELLEQELGADIEVMIVDGSVSSHERKSILSPKAATTGKKRVIVVNADVIREGINLSHISRAVILNHPYNQADNTQLAKRFAREGNEDVRIAIMHVDGTIYDGMRTLIELKAMATSLLKYGCADLDGLDSLFRRGVSLDQLGVALVTPLLDQALTEPEIIERTLAQLHNASPGQLARFRELHGKRFAELYCENWDYSYAANNARFTAALFEELIADNAVETLEGTDALRIADFGAGPLALAEALNQSKLDVATHITSIEDDQNMINAGQKIGNSSNEVLRQSVSDLTGVAMASFDIVNFGLSLNYLCGKRAHLQKKLQDPRVKALREAHRVLKPNGLMTITLEHHIGTNQERADLLEVLRTNFGFEIIDEYSGEVFGAQSTFQGYVITCRKTGELNSNGLNNDQYKLSPTQRNEIKPTVEHLDVETRFTFNGKTINYESDRVGEIVAAEKYYLNQVKGVIEAFADGESAGLGSELVLGLLGSDKIRFMNMPKLGPAFALSWKPNDYWSLGISG